MDWYQVKNINRIDSPALLVYQERVQHNITQVIRQVGGQPERLFPHVKTHKMAEVVQMQLDAGITRFKCSTIAELEMVANTEAEEILLAYQLVPPKLQRFINLQKAFPAKNLASLADNLSSLEVLEQQFESAKLVANIYLDIDNGMHRTGHPINRHLWKLISRIEQSEHLTLKGLHVYDGQFRQNNPAERQKASHDAFAPVASFLDEYYQQKKQPLKVICGGSPSFSAAAQRKEVFCSPGTVFFWDAGYQQIVPELNLKNAAVLLTRVISKPQKGYLTVDLGHKSVGSENPLSQRVHFLNLTNYEVYKHSEEHLMLKVADSVWEKTPIGSPLYAIPFHVCPSVALHDEASIIRDHSCIGRWEVIARKRRITY